VDGVFRFSTADVGFEVEGPGEFVRSQLEFLAPFLGRATGAGPRPPARVPGAPPAEGIEGVGSWWRAQVPPGSDPSVQDTILLFALFMRTYRKTVFLCEDVRRCFQVMGIEEPRSLVQILGNMRRDTGLLLNAGKRGEYMMNTTGIARAKGLLGAGAAGAAWRGGAGAGRPGPVDARNLFKD
jgi:hypothetical protein